VIHSPPQEEQGAGTMEIDRRDLLTGFFTGLATSPASAMLPALPVAVAASVPALPAPAEAVDIPRPILYLPAHIRRPAVWKLPLITGRPLPSGPPHGD
jgi:hypothetical protein